MPESTSQLYLICHEGITASCKEKYILSLVPTDDILGMELNPFWDVIGVQIDQQVDRAVHGSADEQERRILEALWRRNRKIELSVLDKYPDKLLSGLDALKVNLPGSVPWRIYAGNV